MAKKDSNHRSLVKQAQAQQLTLSYVDLELTHFASHCAILQDTFTSVPSASKRAQKVRTSRAAMKEAHYQAHGLQAYLAQP